MRSLSWGIFEFGIACIEIYFMQLVTALFSKEARVIKFWLRVLIFLSAAIINFYVNYWFNDNMVVISVKSIILCFILGIVLNTGKFYWSVLAAFVYYIIMGVTELISTAIITIPQKVDFAVVTTFDARRIQTLIVLNILAFTIIKIFSLFRKVPIPDVPMKIFIPLLALPIFSIMITFQIAYNAVMETTPQSVFTIVCILCLIFINIIVFSLIEGIFRRAEADKKIGIMDAQFQIQKEHSRQIEQTYSQVNFIKHDFKQYISFMQILCEQSKYTELSELIRKLSNEQLGGAKPLIVTGNPAIDAVLSSKRHLAEQQNIRCTWQIVIEPSLQIEELDICVIIGNALDNSIEACMRTAGERYINFDLRINPNKNSLLCKIINPIGEMPERSGEFLKSQKTEEGTHGLGLQSIRHRCESLGGGMSFEYNPEIFELNMIIPITM